jgi:hypothetical protein
MPGIEKHMAFLRLGYAEETKEWRLRRVYGKHEIVPSVSLAHFFVAAAQRQTQFVVELVKVAEFSMYVGQFFLQPELYRSTGCKRFPLSLRSPRISHICRAELESIRRQI